MKEIKKIGVLTSGGDAPGMNAAIRAVVRQGISKGFEVYGIHRGFAGLLKEEITKMEEYSVSDIISRGGTTYVMCRQKMEVYMKEIKKIGVLTSGGDAPGMNAAIRAVVRQGISKGFEVYGIHRGFAGLLKEEITKMEEYSVSDIISRGGTILQTARCLEFLEEEYQKKAADICRKHELDAVVVIGGDGSFKGSRNLKNHGVNTMSLPGTIDLDVSSTEYAIGFDTAVNTAVQAIDRIRDTSTSHERCSIVEVMGRGAGYIALWCSIANGAEDVLLPETYDHDEQKIINHIIEDRKKGKQHHIIINAEGIGDSVAMAKRIEAATGIETRATILGYMQRGGSPTARDRVYASIMGAKAVDLLAEGKEQRVVCYRGGEFTDVDLDEAIAMTKSINQYDIGLSKSLSR